MARTHKKVTHVRKGKRPAYTPDSAARGVEDAFRLIEGRWKLLLLFHLFGGQVRRYSDLQRAIPGISQKMLAQQLRKLESDGVVRRTVYSQVPPKVEYSLSDWGQELCPALDAFLRWAELRPEAATPASR
jgi:DNA-binding HxlR family transcriptional regulator